MSKELTCQYCRQTYMLLNSRLHREVNDALVIAIKFVCIPTDRYKVINNKQRETIWNVKVTGASSTDYLYDLLNQ